MDKARASDKEVRSSSSDKEVARSSLEKETLGNELDKEVIDDALEKEVSSSWQTRSREEGAPIPVSKYQRGDDLIPIANDNPPNCTSTPLPVLFGSDPVGIGRSTLYVTFPDKTFREAAVTDETGTTLYSMRNPSTMKSWSFRRSLNDASGRHVWDLRHYHSKLSEWVVEDAQGKELFHVKEGLTGSGKVTNLQARIPKADGNNVVVMMTATDSSGMRTVFEVDGTTIAEMFLIENNDVMFLERKGLPRSVWKINLAGGIDRPLVLALVFCRAEVSHAWRR